MAECCKPPFLEREMQEVAQTSTQRIEGDPLRDDAVESDIDKPHVVQGVEAKVIL